MLEEWKLEHEEQLNKKWKKNEKLRKDLGIKENLHPYFCLECGCRIGWYNVETGDIPSETYCEKCAKEEINKYKEK